MAAISSCPSESRLRRLLTASSSDDQEALVHHLDHCETCRHTLEKLTGATPALLNAAGASRQHAYAEEAPLRRMLDDLASDARLMTRRRPDSPDGVGTNAAAGGRPGGPGPARRLRSGRRAGPRRHGPGVPGVRPRPEALGGDQGPGPEPGGDLTARPRFAREAQAAAAVRHEHVVTIHAVSDIDGLPYIVMEYLAGGSLQDYLDLNGPPNWRAPPGWPSRSLPAWRPPTPRA